MIPELRRPSLTFSYLDKVIVKRRAIAYVCQSLRGRLINVRATGTQFVPPRRERAGHARLYAIRNLRNQCALAAIIPHAHHIAVGYLAARGVCFIYQNERLSLALEK